ncbi:hypothetical protein CKY39_15260 [Variovorax boronicumulans]|uniref:Uncharacterized protein n=1 Tax=Variovorax boronicumulans TaxID=436515 RepID=A0A250DJI7_9BURK|nr:hypothetical protein CKY39_15260 [Variovorax boronicumulans]
MFAPEHLMAAMLFGLLLGLLTCGLIWAASERAESRVLIERARRRVHARVPVMRWEDPRC